MKNLAIFLLFLGLTEGQANAAAAGAGMSIASNDDDKSSANKLPSIYDAIESGNIDQIKACFPALPKKLNLDKCWERAKKLQVNPAHPLVFAIKAIERHIPGNPEDTQELFQLLEELLKYGSTSEQNLSDALRYATHSAYAGSLMPLLILHGAKSPLHLKQILGQQEKAQRKQRREKKRTAAMSLSQLPTTRSGTKTASAMPTSHSSPQLSALAGDATMMDLADALDLANASAQAT